MNRVSVAPNAQTAPLRRVHVELEGFVQGVGSRPAVYRLATTLGLGGWVANSAGGVDLEIEGDPFAVSDFLRRLRFSLPPLARLDRMRTAERAAAGLCGFRIRESAPGDERSALVVPDTVPCAECLAEIRDPDNRRYNYPFTSCTNCGPRDSTVLGLPYDRYNTTMRHFTLCGPCRREYTDPMDRRFHAQMNACPDCGPQCALVTTAGETRATGHRALADAADALRRGRIVACKGLGGFQLLVDARNEAAVARLRRRKRRPAKPFALMLAGLSAVEKYCEVTAAERACLASAAGPIVLLKRRTRALAASDPLAVSIAPGNPLLGVMLPTTPLHHLLIDELGFPLVATSGNLSGEPLAIDTDEALHRLGTLADCFLVHDREIACPLDDSVVRIVAGRPLLLRRARGYSPLSLRLPRTVAPVLALGGHLKSTAALTVGDRVIVGPHVGDLGSPQARRAFDAAVARLCELHRGHPAAIACDRHPDYHTTHAAGRRGLPIYPVQHHLAHIAACMADNALSAPVLGVAWDGSGYGDDHTVWGGEFFAVDDTGARRVASLRPFPLPGGERAVTEPRRTALGLLYALDGEWTRATCLLAPFAGFTDRERTILGQMLEHGINAPQCTSVGRLFDGVAALLGLVQRSSYEGHAGMALEFAARTDGADARYTIDVTAAGNADAPLVLDWAPMLRSLLADIARGLEVREMAAAVHRALADAIVVVAQRLGESRVALSGGCFQNALLTQCTVSRLRAAGLQPFWHREVPPNDGGLALGQAMWAAREIEQEKR